MDETPKKEVVVEGSPKTDKDEAMGALVSYTASTLQRVLTPMNPDSTTVVASIAWSGDRINYASNVDARALITTLDMVQKAIIQQSGVKVPSKGLTVFGWIDAEGRIDVRTVSETYEEALATRYSLVLDKVPEDSVSHMELAAELNEVDPGMVVSMKLAIMGH